MEAPLPSFHRIRPPLPSAARLPPRNAASSPAPLAAPARRTAPAPLSAAPTKRPRICSPPRPPSNGVPDVSRQLERMRAGLHALERLPPAAPALRPTSVAASNAGPSSSRSRPRIKTRDDSGRVPLRLASTKALPPSENKPPSKHATDPCGSPLRPDPHRENVPAGKSAPSPTPDKTAARGLARPLKPTDAKPSKERIPQPQASWSPSQESLKRLARPSASRWSAALCQAQYHAYRDVAHSVKKRADALANSPGGLDGKKWDTVGLMLADSFLLYAYASWARDQYLRFDASEGAEPLLLPLERSTDGRGVKEWEQLFPLLEHAMHQLRKRSTLWSAALDALLLMLRSRITFVRAAYTEGWVTRYLTKSSSKGADLGLFASHLSTALSHMDEARNMENKARATLTPAFVEKSFPSTWAALGRPSADLRTAATHTLALDPSSLETIVAGSSFLSRSRESKGREGGPLFPPPNGSDGPAHLIVLGRMLVAETAQKERLDYDLAPVFLSEH